LACFNERESPHPVSARGGATTRKSEWHPARLQGRNRGAPLGAGTPTFDRPIHQPWGRAMKLTRGTNSLPQMTAAEFAAAMKHYGFGVCRARIVDTTGQWSRHLLVGRAPRGRVGGPKQDAGEDPSGPRWSATSPRRQMLPNARTPRLTGSAPAPGQQRTHLAGA
jgi:hypothetical protein